MDKLIREIIEEMNCRKKTEYKYLLESKAIQQYFQEVVLGKLGYEDWVQSASNVKGQVEDTIYRNRKRGEEQIYVRVADYESIKNQEIFEFIKTHQKAWNLDTKNEWGILTDCASFILTNATIIDLQQPMESVIFRINITVRDYGRKMLGYFSYNNLFQTENTRYFVGVSKFRLKNILKSKKSFQTYKSTLWNFFDFYGKKHPYKSMSNGKREPLERISFEDFKEFIIDKQGERTKLLKEDTVYNNYSHIAGYLKGMEIQNADFGKDRNFKLQDFDVDRECKKLSFFTKSNVEIMIDFFDDGKIHSNRNVLLLYLLIYMGMEKSAILDLKWENFEIKNRRYKKNQVEIELPQAFIKRLEKLKKENQDNKEPFVFTTYNKGLYKRPSDGAINRIFNELKETDNKYENVSPLYIRNALAEFLFEAGFSIEEICYLMNIKASNILSYISENKIMEEGKKRLDGNINRHPFYHSLDEQKKKV